MKSLKSMLIAAALSAAFISASFAADCGTPPKDPKEWKVKEIQSLPTTQDFWKRPWPKGRAAFKTAIVLYDCGSGILVPNPGDCRG